MCSTILELIVHLFIQIRIGACIYFLVVKQPRELAVKLSKVWIRILINDMVFSSKDFLIDSEYGLSGRKGKTALFLHSCVRHSGKQRSRTLEDSGP